VRPLPNYLGLRYAEEDHHRTSIMLAVPLEERPQPAGDRQAGRDRSHRRRRHGQDDLTRVYRLPAAVHVIRTGFAIYSGHFGPDAEVAAERTIRGRQSFARIRACRHRGG
jgi:hypothetical protein